ncbi:CocE/NonD family hydrolase [Paenibacillus sp. GbtcB18]|uniref:CocE/NonD family hydrolase n=1 Tax=Paenibacillus sp. GbtcB18 TaxID=2824763 RepID=UPI001C2F49D4|nr:CocE/NonD family hydrolase [Paenibacillus sp. GbtcB18]
MKQSKMLAALFISVMIAITFFPSGALRAETTKVSELNRYEGYSQAAYSGWVKSSEYVEVRDGTKLAVDIFRPANDGVATNEKLPVIWTHARYHRAYDQNVMLDYEPWLRTTLSHGYVVAAVDARGTGASFGSRYGEFPEEEAMDAYDITEWLAAKEWSNGNIGMYGRSYLGITQLLAAGQKPPHLKAIIPQMSMFDAYGFIYSGGIFKNGFMRNWGAKVNFLDKTSDAVKVDEDKDGSLFKAAQQEHQKNMDPYSIWSILDTRDGFDEITNKQLFTTRSPSSYLKGIEESGVAIYQISGWYDIWTKDAFLWHSNVSNPRRLMIGPWPHGVKDDLSVEHIRWFDYYLKGIENNIAKEDPIQYYTMSSEGQKGGWRSTDVWPLNNQQVVNFYFEQGDPNAKESVNSGLLSMKVPKGKDAVDKYTVDYTTTTGPESRWNHAAGGLFNYPDLSTNDAKGLTYTTTALSEDVEVTGHPVVKLSISSSNEDSQVFAYLEDISPNGESKYVTEGAIKASHHKESKPIYNNLGLPFHSGNKADIENLKPGEIVNLSFDLIPTSYIFEKGHRIRLTITGSDIDNALTPIIKDANFSIFRNSVHSSFIELPVIGGTLAATAEKMAKEDDTGPTFFNTTQLVIGGSIILILLLAALYFLSQRNKKNPM